MNIDLDHFETLEELERDLMSWIKEEDIYSFDRYLNKEDVLKIVRMLIISNLEIERLNNIINKAIEYINNHQLVFRKSSKKQIEEWFDMFYKEVTDILKGEENESENNS